MKTFKKDKGAAAIIGAVIAVLVTLAIGLVVTNGVMNGITRTGWTTAQNTTFTALVAGVGSTYAIANIYPLVLIAGAMLAVIAGTFMANR